MNLPHFMFGIEGTCTYCGDPSQSRDHIFPIAPEVPVRKGSKYREMHGPTTPACTQCNSRLSTRLFQTFDDRCKFISERLNHEAKPILWSKAELNELDYSLKTHVYYVQRRLYLLRLRADWYSSPDAIRNIENLQWQTQVNSHPFLREYFKTTIEAVDLHYANWGKSRGPSSR